jgi:lipid-binding SYLF domain-containing protein
LAVLLLLAPATLAGEAEEKAQKKREKIDQMAKQTLERLRRENPRAQRLLDQAYGYAVLDSTKMAIGIGGSGRGVGVAVDTKTGDRTYLKIYQGGVGLGLGLHMYQVVVLFQEKGTFRDFLDGKWIGEGEAHAAAGEKGAATEATFVNGVVSFHFTEKGLMARADIGGARIKPYEKLNKPQ